MSRPRARALVVVSFAAGMLALRALGAHAAQERTPPPSQPIPIEPMPAAPVKQAPPPTALPQDAPAPNRDASAPPVDTSKLPWPVVLGLRVANVEHRIPTLDRVVLVPDEATFLDEISRWSPQVHWPVLIEDERWAPLFVRGFKPAQVFRRTDRAAPLPADPAARRRLIEAAITRAWAGDPVNGTPASAFKALGLAPAGIVVMSTADPAWTAGVALAAGRGQFPAFIDGGLGQPSDTLDAKAFATLSRAVDEAFRATGVPYGALGDELESCTLCRTVAAKCTPDLPQGVRFSAPGAPATNPSEPLAVTDVLCRNPDGTRYAICGAIWGDATRSAYTAMCSLFLTRTKIDFISAYGETGNHSAFGVAQLQEIFEPAGYKLNPMVGSSATLRAWQRLAMGGFDADVLFVNSSGDCLTFHLGVPGQTKPEDQGTSLDIPLLARPLALQMVHSFSLEQPGSMATIGGRWIDHGVYAYVGSVYEPYMTAFVPPRDVMKRIEVLFPFLVAGRHLEGPFAAPWRIATFGDPLMLASQPAKPVRIRLAAETREPDAVSAGGRTLASLRESATARLRACQSDPTPENFRVAFTELDKLGDDAIAVNLWTIAAQKKVRGGCARAALGALFRARDLDAFLDAFRAVEAPDPDALDMLWALATPRISTIDSPEFVDLLANNARALRLDVDLVRLAPAVSRLRGREAARMMLMKGIERTKDARSQQLLREAAGTY